VGRKPVVCLSFLVFLAASLGCGFARNVEQLIGFRAAQGIGGAGLYAMAMIIYPEITPLKLVPVISSVVGLIVALAGVSGPIIGGLLTTYASWRWVFWIK
jgi:MFS family permease